MARGSATDRGARAARSGYDTRMRACIAAAIAAAGCGHIGFAGTGDASGDAAADASPYHDVTQPSLWTTFDAGQLGGTGYGTFAFDGRYIYPVPTLSMAL